MFIVAPDLAERMRASGIWDDDLYRVGNIVLKESKMDDVPKSYRLSGTINFENGEHNFEVPVDITSSDVLHHIAAKFFSHPQATSFMFTVVPKL